MRDIHDEALLPLSLPELSRALALSPDWLVERVQAGFIEVTTHDAAGPTGWRFDSLALRRVRSMRHVEHCYGAPPELAALVADLEDEILRLRARLQRPDR